MNFFVFFFSLSKLKEVQDKFLFYNLKNIFTLSRLALHIKFFQVKFILFSSTIWKLIPLPFSNLNFSMMILKSNEKISFFNSKNKERKMFFPVSKMSYIINKLHGHSSYATKQNILMPYNDYCCCWTFSRTFL